MTTFPTRQRILDQYVATAEHLIEKGKVIDNLTLSERCEFAQRFKLLAEQMAPQPTEQGS